MASSPKEMKELISIAVIPRDKINESKEKKEAQEESVKIDIKKSREEFSSFVKKDKTHKSFRFDIGMKYGKRMFSYLLVIGFGLLIAYLIAPTLDVPPQIYIIPIAITIVGPLFSTKMNRLIDSFSFFMPSVLLDDNSVILSQAENRIAELKALDKKNENDKYALLVRELENNVSICQGINDVGSRHFVNLFIEDIKVLMSIPSRSMAEIYQANFSQKEMREKRALMLTQAKNIFKSYDLKTRHALSNFFDAILDRTLPLKGHHHPHRVKTLFLNGPPGIGKTFLITEISKIFGIPLCIINMGTETLEKFEGRMLPSPMGLPKAEPGLVVKAATNQSNNPFNCKDLIIFLDEIDKGFDKGENGGVKESTAKLIAFLHTFLQVDILKVEDKGFNIPIDFERVYIVLAGNRNCFEDDYIVKSTQASLRQRVSVITMPDLSTRAKINILGKILKTTLSNDSEVNKFTSIIIEILMGIAIQAVVNSQTSTLEKKPESAPDKISDKLSFYYNLYNVNTKEAKEKMEEDKTKKDSKPKTGLRKALRKMDKIYQDHLVLLDERYGVKSIAGIVESYLTEEEIASYLKKEENVDNETFPSEENTGLGAKQPLLRHGRRGDGH